MKDTGIGMDASYLPKLFDAFSQENTSSTNKYGSTGLGMAITKNIVEMMNGNISVDSVKGGGTTFTVNVTLRNSDRRYQDMSDVQPQNLRVLAIDNGADLNGRRILFAEDVLINAEILKEVLKMMGMESDHVENGKLALQLFTEHPVHYYDAILMDMRMPVMDGLTATKEIRASGKADSATIPIIALTAIAFDEDVQRSLQAGMNAHLLKPIEPERLYDTLASLIRDR